MTYVITQKCVGTCDSACVDVCPCDCIHGLSPIDELRRLPPDQRGQLYIDPDPCIDCGACVAECPVDAIVYEDDATAEDRERNARFFTSRPPCRST